MDDYHNTDLSALDIYRNYHRSGRHRNQEDYDRQFFIRLRSAMLRELQTQGSCSFINALIQEKTGPLDAVSGAVIVDISRSLEGKPLTDVSENLAKQKYIPNIFFDDKRVPWARADRGNFTLEYLFEDLCKIQKAFETSSQKREQPGREPESSAEKQAENLLNQVRAQAEQIMAQAKAEAERIREEARQEAGELMDEAAREAKTYAAKKAEELIARYLANEQRAYKTELNQEMQKFSATSMENSARAMTIHSRMFDATNELQANWIRTLDEFAGRITDVKSELYSFLHNWQVSLFPGEIRPLAERYLELYRILNVDRLLREEILLETSAETKTEQAGSAEQEAGGSDIRIAALQKLNKTLTTFLRRFEMSLNGLDLYVFYPQPGEEFDEIWHLPNDEEEDYTGRRIIECVVPGIAKKANDGFGDDVLIPAVVRAEDESEV